MLEILMRMSVAPRAGACPRIDPVVLLRTEQEPREGVQFATVARLADALDVSLDDLAASVGLRRAREPAASVNHGVQRRFSGEKGEKAARSRPRGDAKGCRALNVGSLRLRYLIHGYLVGLLMCTLQRHLIASVNAVAKIIYVNVIGPTLA